MFCERVPYIERRDEDDKPFIKSGNFQLRRGFEIKEGEKVLIAEDVTTTTKSIGEIAELIFKCNAKLIGVISIIDRRKYKYDGWKYKDIEIPYISLIQLDINTWKPEECPLCKKTCETCKLFGNECDHRTKLECTNIKSNWTPKYPLIKPGSRK